MSAKNSTRFVRTVKVILKLTLKDRIKMVVTCVLLFLLVSNTSVSGWLTWYASTHHDPSTTPGASDSNEIGHQTDSTRSIPAELDILRLLNVSGATPGVSEVLGPSAHLPAYKFRPGYNNVLVPDPGAIAAALTAPAGFTLLFVYRQPRKTLGTDRKSVV